MYISPDAPPHSARRQLWASNFAAKLMAAAWEIINMIWLSEILIKAV